jgi:delta14-sterol reductase
MGPPGAAVMIFGLPVAVYGLYLLCPPHACTAFQSGWPYLSLPSLDFSAMEFFSLQSLLVVLGWFFLHVLLERTLPGEIVKGTVLRDGKVLEYKINGLTAMFVSLSLVIAGHFAGAYSLSSLHDHFLSLITAAVLFSAVLSIYLYLRSFGKDRLLATGGNSGNAVYDFFIGRELNPRIGSFDLKVFCELRPGLIGWAVLNLAMASKEYDETGSVSAGMILVNAFQFYYVFDAQLNESSILTTMDVTTDGFGYMLCFGDLVWVPFTYTLQCRYLATHPSPLSVLQIVIIIALQLIGLWIFRGANSQKDLFRTNPNHPAVKHLKYIDTARGTRLMISGWWGVSRHINYFGDWLMAWAWCLPCGFASPVPYFYVIYFAMLLIHRQMRDDHQCTLKYGADWDRYCKEVPYRIVPYFY